MANELRTRDGLPFNFVDGLRIKGVDVTNWDKVFIDQGASYVGFTPVGNLAASNVQAAIAELESEKQSKTEPITTAINLRPGANQGVVWDNDAFGGTQDTASITLETAAGEATKMRFKMTNDSDDNFEFTAKTPDGLTAYNNAMTLNGNVLLNAANYVDYTAPMISDYTALRAYTGNASQVRITANGLAGFFYYDATDTSSVDNDGTVIVANNGKRWKRIFDGYVNIKWFGAAGNGITDDTVTIQTFFDYCRISNKTAFISQGVYRLSQVNVSWGMTIIAETGAVFKLLDNQPASTRMITTQNFLWSVSPQTENSPPLTIYGLTLDGNQLNQGAYLNHEKEQQHAIFITSVGTSLPSPYHGYRISADIQNCKIINTCGDGISVYKGVIVNVENCNFWNCYRGSVVSIGSNCNIIISNCYAGGDRHSSRLQAEVTGGGLIDGYMVDCTVSNCIFDHLKNDKTGDTATETIGLDLTFPIGSKLTVSNCIFKAGFINLNMATENGIAVFESCIFRMIQRSYYPLTSPGKAYFNNCTFEICKDTKSLLSACIAFRELTDKKQVAHFSSCNFVTEKDYHSDGVEMDIISATQATLNAVTLELSAGHPFVAGDFVTVSGFSPSAYNGVWRLESVTSTTAVFTTGIKFGDISLITAKVKKRKSATAFYLQPMYPSDGSILKIDNCSIDSGYNFTFDQSTGGKVILSNVFADSAMFARFFASGAYWYDILVSDLKIGPNLKSYGLVYASVDTGNTLHHVNVAIDENVNSVRSPGGNNNFLKHKGSRTIYGASTPLSAVGSGTAGFIGDVWKIKTPISGKPSSYISLNNSNSMGLTSWRCLESLPAKDTTANRPTLATIDIGVRYFDTTLDPDGKPIWWTGTAWVDSAGTVV